MTVTDPIPNPTDPTPDPQPTPKPTPGKKPDAAPIAPEDTPTLTQKQVDAIIGNRVLEAKSASLLELAKKLGYETVEEMEADAKETKARKDGEKTELQKAQEKADKLTADLEAAKKLAADEAAKRIAVKVDSRLEALATKAGAVHPSDIVEHLRLKRPDDVAKLVDEKEVVDEKAAEKLIEAVRKDRENWFAGTRGVGSPSVMGGRPLQPDADMNKRATEQLRRQIRNS